MTEDDQTLAFMNRFIELQESIHRVAVEKGFWDNPRTDAEFAKRIALIHSELSEALEASREIYEGSPVSEKIPPFTKVEEELADAAIRILDLAAGEGLSLSAAILAKHHYNKTRPHKHGKKF